MKKTGLVFRTRETREEKMVSSKKHFRDVDVDTGCGPRPE